MQNIETGGVVTFTIKINGAPIDSTVAILSIRVEKNVNRIATAYIVVKDDVGGNGDFENSSSSAFIPGASVVIDAGYDAREEVIFRGIITGQSISINAQTGSTLEVVCRDAAVAMTVGRKCITYCGKTDGEIITEIITRSGLTPDVTATTTKWPQQVQYYTTDWDFMLVRADMNGLIVTALDGKVAVKRPDANTASVLTAGYGDGLLEFTASMNAVTQLSSVSASSWDYEAQVKVTGTAKNEYAGPGNISSNELAKVVGLENYELQTTAPMDTGELTDWSKAQLVKSDYSKIQGEAKFQGTSIVAPGNYITLAGLGGRFNGDHFVSQVVHDISDGNWFTEMSIGLSSAWFAAEPDVMAPPASGVLPGARGLFNATVKKIADDPESQFRILVDVPVLDTKGAGIWARLSGFYATNGAGAFFLPEVGDEVVLGFLNEDPRYPVILGSMYSNPKMKPFAGLDAKAHNPLKAIVSRSGIAMTFDDENKVLTIETPGKNKVVLSDNAKTITLSDENKNTIEMSATGISLTSQGDINIAAGKTLTLEGAMGVKVQAASGDVDVHGTNIKETADLQYSAGGIVTQIKAAGEMTLKGAMIMIN